jgi:hypothetical protein
MMMLVLEFTTEFLSVSLCESSLLFMAGSGGCRGGVSVDHPHLPSPSPLAGGAVAAADYTYKDSPHREINAATARPSKLFLSGWRHMS